MSKPITRDEFPQLCDHLIAEAPDWEKALKELYDTLKPQPLADVVACAREVIHLGFKSVNSIDYPWEDLDRAAALIAALVEKETALTRINTLLEVSQMVRDKIMPQTRGEDAHVGVWVCAEISKIAALTPANDNTPAKEGK